MNLNSSSVISKFFHLNSGLSLYLSNSSSHSEAELGGGRPASVQSVMLRPDSVSLQPGYTTQQWRQGYLVTPPSTTAPTHIPAVPASHHPTWTARYRLVETSSVQ